MLVLSRRPNESIVIDGNIHIKVVSIRGRQVRLGIEAPDWVAVFREELCVPAGAVAEAGELSVDLEDHLKIGTRLAARLPTAEGSPLTRT